MATKTNSDQFHESIENTNLTKALENTKNAIKCLGGVNTPCPPVAPTAVIHVSGVNFISL
jgi:hypothetical protein